MKDVSEHHTDETLRIHAWVQLGVERRETVIEIPEADVADGFVRCVEQNILFAGWLQDYVKDWIEAFLAWGWSGAGFDILNDAYGSSIQGWCVTDESSIPNTRVLRRPD